MLRSKRFLRRSAHLSESVRAYVSLTKERRSKDAVQISGIEIHRGELRLAESDSGEEKRLYLSGADVSAAKEKDKDIARQRFPQPLRDLLKVRQRRDDSNVNHLSGAIQEIRDAPDPKLFQQLVQEMHEGTQEVRSLLEAILLNELGILKLKPWDKSKKGIAVSACIEALPLSKEPTQLVEILLRVYGGGRIEIKGEHGGTSVEVVRIANGHSVTLGNAERPLAMEEVQKELRRRFAISNGESSGSVNCQ